MCVQEATDIGRFPKEHKNEQNACTAFICNVGKPGV